MELIDIFNIHINYFFHKRNMQVIVMAKIQVLETFCRLYNNLQNDTMNWFLIQNSYPGSVRVSMEGIILHTGKCSHPNTVILQTGKCSHHNTVILYSDKCSHHNTVTLYTDIKCSHYNTVMLHTDKCTHPNSVTLHTDKCSHHNTLMLHR